MKKIIATIAIMITISLGSVMAQGSDGFFNFIDLDRSDIEDPEAPHLPYNGLNTSVSAPIGPGVLLLAGFGVAYAMFRKKDEE